MHHRIEYAIGQFFKKQPQVFSMRIRLYFHGIKTEDTCIILVMLQWASAKTIICVCSAHDSEITLALCDLLLYWSPMAMSKVKSISE